MSLPPSSICVQHLGLERLCLAGRRRRPRRPARRGPSSSSRTCRGCARRRRASSSRGAGSPPRRRPPARRCRRCSSAPHVEAAVAQQAHEGVAEAGVAQVADVRGLVRVDARVLDDHVAGTARRRPLVDERLVQLLGDLAALEEQVQVAAARDLGAHARPSPSAARRRAARRSRAASCAASSRGRTGPSGRGPRAPRGAGTGTRCSRGPRRRPRGRPPSPRRKGAVEDPGSQPVILSARSA